MKTFLVPIRSLREKKSTMIYAINLASQVGVEKIYGIQLDEIKEDDHLESMIALAEEKDIELNFRPIDGNPVEYINEFCESFHVDLVITSSRIPKTNDKLFLDRLSGSIIRKTALDVLLVPDDYKFKHIDTVLTVIKSGVVKKNGILKPLTQVLEAFDARMTLLQVKTPKFLDEDLMFDKDLAALTSRYFSTENATVFQGVLEYMHKVNPDMICVFRRKRGFFKKLWSNTLNDNSIKRSDFESRVPLLVLKEEQVS